MCQAFLATDPSDWLDTTEPALHKNLVLSHQMNWNAAMEEDRLRSELRLPVAVTG
jgi:hypothetical protein